MALTKQQELRLEVLTLAVKTHEQGDRSNARIIRTAEQFYNYITKGPNREQE